MNILQFQVDWGDISDEALLTIPVEEEAAEMSPVPLPDVLPTDSPRQLALNSSRQPPLDPPRQPPLDSPEQLPVDSPRQLPLDLPRQLPLDSPKRLPVDSPRQLPLNSSMELRLDSPRQLVLDSPMQLPLDSPRQLPLDSPPEQLPLDSPRQLPLEQEVPSTSFMEDRLKELEEEMVTLKRRMESGKSISQWSSLRVTPDSRSPVTKLLAEVDEQELPVALAMTTSACKLADVLFSPGTLRRSSMSGRDNLETLDPDRVSAIKHRLRIHFGARCTTTVFNALWKRCRLSLSAKCKHQRQKAFRKSLFQ